MTSNHNKFSVKPQSVGFYKYHDVILGKGNFATVYLARHKVIGCEVALKVINRAEIEEEYLKKNLDREASILRSLQHPNIIRLYEVIQSSTFYCLSLEVIRGVNLYQYMINLKTQSISERLARIFFYQMLSAVEYMHRVHVMHRDLKLENILVEFGHVIKIVDFGLSNVYYPTYVLRTHCGSVEYAAPELFKSKSVYGTAADVWSLGVILYAMVVGKMPFKFSQKNNNDKTVDDQETSHKREKFVKRVSKGLMQENWELMEELSPECWDLLHEMLQPDQFCRIRIERAISHPWIRKDENLQRRLPQSRKDLERKFHSEIVNYLASILNTSTSRIEKHIHFQPFDKISAIYYIARDMLIKEVLHPPQPFESSFLYRFECWRQSRPSLYSIGQNRDYGGKDVYQNYDPVNSEKKCLPKFSLELSSNVADDSIISPTLSNDKSIRNEKKVSPRSENDDNQKEPEKSPLKISRKFVTFESINVDSNNEPHIEEPKQVSRNAYRSYKNSRPKTVAFLKNEDKSLDKQSDGKHQTENQSTGKNVSENNNRMLHFSKGNTGDSERLGNLSKINKLPGKRQVNSRPQTLAFLKSEDKIVDKQSDEKHQTENQSTGKNLSENNNRMLQFSKRNTGDSKRLEKPFENNKLDSKRQIIPPPVEPNERISKIVIKSKSSESKVCESNCIKERYCYSEGTRAKPIAPSNSDKSFRRKPRETTGESSRSIKNSANPPEFIESQVKRNNAGLLTRSYQPSNCLKDKREDTLKKTELRSRIPTQNVHIGKPSPYYKTFNAERRISLKRGSVADRISLCQGDTKE